MYTSFTIENFRLFDRLTVEPLARVNLIVGRNNAGKTALLEALWLHTGQNNPELARRINVWRSLPGSEPGEFFSDLFRGYQTRLPIKLTAEYTGEDNSGILTITRQLRLASAMPMASSLPDGPRPLSQSDDMYETEIEFEYVDTQGDTFTSHAWVETAPIPFELQVPPGIQQEVNLSALRVQRDSQSDHRANSVFMQSLGRIAPIELATRFGRAEIKGYLGEVESVLQLVEPRLRRLTAVPTSDGPALIYGDIGAERIIPIALMGSGFARLLEITLAFAEIANGSILIDEIENGLHHSVMQEVWKAINGLSQKFNVQVFATTHSYECMAAARDAFKEMEDDDLRIHRISRRDDRKAATYSFEGIDYMLDLGAEMR